MYAAPRTEIKELHQARALLVEKFGKEFALAAMDGTGVAARVLSKLKVDTPPRELVDAYLREISRTYGVRFPGDPLDLSDDEDDDDDDEEAADDDEEGGGGGGGGLKHKALEAPVEAEELSRATPPRDVGVSSPLRIAPPSPSVDNVAPKLKLPGAEERKKARKASTGAADAKKPKAVAKKDKKDADGGPPGGRIPNVDELAKRFAELKQR